MTKTETAKILAVLRVYYPRDIADEQDLKVKTNAWHKILQDYTYEQAEAAVLAFVTSDRKGFMPSPGQILGALRDVREAGEMSAQDAWALASKAAAGNLAWEELPRDVQRAIGSRAILRQWYLVPSDTFNTVIYSQFLKSYRIQKDRNAFERALPAEVRAVIAGLAEKMSLPPAEEREPV